MTESNQETEEIKELRRIVDKSTRQLEGFRKLFEEIQTSFALRHCQNVEPHCGWATKIDDFKEQLKTIEAIE